MKSIVFLSTILLFACQNSDKKVTTTPKISDILVAPINKDSILVIEAKKIVNLIAQKDYLSLATVFHPDGVRFSMYGYVDSTADLRLKSDDFSKNLTKKRKWGIDYGNEKPINKNTNDYFKRHVYDADFLSVTSPTCNKSTPTGSSIMNTVELYKDCDYVEFHKAGTNPKFDGMDWRTLHIVLKKVENSYRLVGIVHNEWTP